ncbi:MAG: NAD(P)H-dependent oxidoreductase subunit E [Burkholderiaceae bacterium]
MNAPDRSQRLLSDDAYARIDRELAKFPADQRQSAVMRRDWLSRRDETREITPEIERDIASYIGIAPTAVHEVATFYKYHCTTRVRLARSRLPCAPACRARCGAMAPRRVSTSEEPAGHRLWPDRSPDGQFTLVESECLGLVVDALWMLVDNKEMHSFMSSERMDALLEQLKSR